MVSLAPRRPLGAFTTWSRAQIYALAMLALVNMSNYMDRAIFAILQQPMKEDLHLQDWQLGILSGPAFALFYSLAGIPMARLAERFNRVTLLGAALSAWSFATAMCGAAVSFIHLVLARIGVGAAEGACTPTTHALISDVFPAKQRGLAMAWLTTSIPVAQMIAPLIGGAVAMHWGWRTAFMAIGLPGIALAFVLWITLKDPREAHARSTTSRAPSQFWPDVKLLFSNRAFALLFVASTFMGIGITCTNMFTASYFLRQYNLTLGEVGMLSAAGMGVAGLIGTFTGGFLADRFAGAYGRSYPAICGIGALLASVLFFITFTRDVWTAAVPFLLLANVSTDLKNGPNFAAAQNMAPKHMRATASAVLMLGAVALGGGVGPFILGAISDIVAAHDFPTTFGVFSEVCPVKDAGTALAAACSKASAAGLRGGLMAPCAAFVIAGTCFLLSARAIRERLDD
jgi:predicted MFS family arabinose efflux permease